MIEITEVEQNWLKQQQDNALAKLCLFHARAINLLDIGVKSSGSLSLQVTYSSQSVFETLKGREELIDYFSKKVESFLTVPVGKGLVKQAAFARRCIH